MTEHALSKQAAISVGEALKVRNAVLADADARITRAKADGDGAVGRFNATLKEVLEADGLDIASVKDAKYRFEPDNVERPSKVIFEAAEAK